MFDIVLKWLKDIFWDLSFFRDLVAEAIGIFFIGGYLIYVRDKRKNKTIVSLTHKRLFDLTTKILIEIVPEFMKEPNERITDFGDFSSWSSLEFKLSEDIFGEVVLNERGFKIDAIEEIFHSLLLDWENMMLGNSYIYSSRIRKLAYLLQNDIQSCLENSNVRDKPLVLKVDGSSIFILSKTTKSLRNLLLKKSSHRLKNDDAIERLAKEMIENPLEWKLDIDHKLRFFPHWFRFIIKRLLIKNRKIKRS